jgi:hypothetical protein
VVGLGRLEEGLGVEEGTGLVRRREDGVVWRELEGEVILLDLRSSMYFTLNDTGRLLWDALARPSTFASLSNSIVEAYGVADAQAAADVQAFLADLVEHELLEAVDPDR